MDKFINFDKAATTAVDKEVLKKIIPYFVEYYGNPSSNYELGHICKNKIMESREYIADYIGSQVDDVYFTSSASESNNWMIKSYIENYSGDIIMTPIEHKDILKCVRNEMGKIQTRNYYTCLVDEDGLIDLTNLDYYCRHCAKGSLVIIQAVNNEIGVIQDLQSISNIIHKYEHYMMVDATQAITHINIDVKNMKIDALSFGGHKINAMKGIGVLSTSLSLCNMIYGSQEKGNRGSTENVPGIISIMEALKLERNNLYIGLLRDYIEMQVTSKIDDTYIVGNRKYKAPHITNICFKGCNAQSMQALLDMDGIEVSTGSACNSYNPKPSYVLKAIGLSDDDIYCCLRFSFDGMNTKKEIDYVVQRLCYAVEILKNK